MDASPWRSCWDGRAVHGAVNGTTAIPWRRSRKRQSLLEQLSGCRQAWCPGAPWDREAVHSALRGTLTGSFLVVRDGETSQPSLLCVSAGGDDEAVLDYDITCKDTVFCLSGSRLCFSDLAHLVFFYSLTRDVLPLHLNIPHWFQSVSNNRLPSLEPTTWLHAEAEPQMDDMTAREPGPVLCSIQFTSTNGALCIINPLYLREHGDDWLTYRAASSAPPSDPKRRQCFGTSRSRTGTGLQGRQAVSLDKDTYEDSKSNTSLLRATSADSPVNPAEAILRRQSGESTSSLSNRGSTGSLPLSSSSSTGSLNSAALEQQLRGSPVPQSPHRVSWIEDGVWLPPPRSLLHPPSMDLDSLSVSSIEEEQEVQLRSPASHQPPSAHRLADKVIHRLSAVGQAIGGLMCPKKKFRHRVEELSERRSGTFAEAVRGFVDTTLKRGTEPGGLNGSELLQEVRSSLTSLRETLLEYVEIQALLDSITDLNDLELDELVEMSVQKVALKPVSAHLYSCITSSRTADGTLQRLQSNLMVLKESSVEELGGAAGVGVPDALSLERIQQKWSNMHVRHSPNRKVEILLKVCKSIYHSMSANASSGEAFGADDFLPCLTWVLLRSELATLQVDTDYMMELLDPTQLQGEGGYYLTTLYAALYYISSFQPRVAARQLSVEAQNSLNQWHRRRTLHCNQSRRSKHRRTIRRQSCHKCVLPMSDSATGSSDRKEEEPEVLQGQPEETEEKRAGELEKRTTEDETVEQT
ncbi:ras and Rab interactor 2-like isoform X2 [Synchiropus splendidus]|uniref:ras and Rab interactor 2-like isoform X2 n=1 Tax=Synchiropus splendidus TaxID=270530 RepID=UPI00237E4DFC|nr:ras and Rab interactor 2-like isoform X2 [Synchiropus splendidus]